MKKVYVLMGGCIDDQHIVGIYTSEKKAEEERKNLIKKETLDSWDEDEERIVLKALDLYYGGNWDSEQIRGCCQGDWALVYFDSSEWSKESIEALEIEYFNLGEEWVCSCTPITDEEAKEATEEDTTDEVWVYVYSWNEESKRKEIADAIGCNENEVVMFKHCGVVNYSVYDRV